MWVTVRHTKQITWGSNINKFSGSQMAFQVKNVLSLEGELVARSVMCLAKDKEEREIGIIRRYEMMIE